MMGDVTDDDRAILEFEETHTRADGIKQGRIRQVFGISAATYYQRLNQLMDDPAAVASFPALVKSLQRQRAERVSRRLNRRF
jgi:hypothetical protein